MAVSVTDKMAPRRLRLRARWARTPNSFRIGAVILAIHLIVAATGPLWAPYGYAQMGAGPPLSGMSWAHPFGIDQLGRDVFSRVVHGAHIVILLSLSGTALGLVIGAIVGLLSGYLGGWFDNLLQRVLEALISIPFLVLRLRGESAWSVMRRELLPNATSVLLVEFALRAGYAPVLIGSLGFLGFGMRPPTPEWGLMISENRALLIVSPITVLGPSLALASLVVGLNLFTEGLARILGRTVRLGER
jgi:peptide/nickel transport system permease protein